MRILTCALVSVLLVGCSSSGATGGTGTGGGTEGAGGASGGGAGGSGGATGGGTGGAGGGATTQNVQEVEPNDGPGLTGMQDLGTFDVPKTIVLKGKLATGGNDGTKYTGDYDGVVFNVAAAGGTLTVSVDWTGTADVDLVTYDANLNPVFSDGTTAKPIASNGPAPAGKFAIVLFSKDLPADWTMTLTYAKPVAGTGGSCTSTLAANETGGCKFTLIEPANGQSITLPAELGFSSCGCETPAKVYIYGNPPTLANSYTIEKSRFQAPLCSWTGRTQITQADLTQFGVTSDNGVYHWQVRSFHGSLSPARTFTISPTVCK